MENYVDISYGEETVPIGAEACVVEALKEEGFKYSQVNLMTSASGLDPSEICYDGCACIVLSCDDESCEETCHCLDKFGGNYVIVTSDDGTKKILLDIDDHVNGQPTPPIFECNSMCKCSDQCINREVQRGVKVPLFVFQCDDDGRGFGVRTLEPLHKGQFICEYAGDILDTSEAANRSSRQKFGDMNYVIGVREHTEEGSEVTFIDPQKRGNVGRFLNHSCDPNLIMIPVRCDSEIVRLALFARRNIEAQEELTFHYGGRPDEFKDNSCSKIQRKKCLCGSQNCEEFLPFDPSLFPHYANGN
ncbi:histone-lysine N-methyltransferase SETMAR-like [Clavelina lepadiformis]|uniref:Histone-lysine N-methyltransferase SETMAR n=1 Tax=Clavelina lepadiformis TaxID=159417 RepID=A0ABP0GBX6_CLALP